MSPLSDVSLVFNILSRNRASAGINKAADDTRSANLRAAASALALKAAEASAFAWAVAAGSAISGSVGLIPGAMEVATASVLGLKAATAGLGAAWKALGAQQASAGPSAASLAKQHATAVREVSSAQEALAKSQRDALDAQRAISTAEETATKDLRDMTLSLAGAHLDEQSATLAVVDAQRQLAQAQRTGSFEDIQKANIALQQSVIDLQAAKNKTADLTEESGKANKAGVEGSDAVVQARQKAADATQAVTDATQRLADAKANLASAGSGGGGIDPAAVAMAKLSANARGLILTLKDLGPAWTTVRKSLQDHAFAGVSQDVRTLSDAYLPTMRTRLAGMGDAFNVAIRKSLGILSTKKSVSEVNTILGDTNKFLTIMGQALAPIISGLLGIGSAGSSFMPQMATWIKDTAQGFATWVEKAKASGQLGTWLSTAENALHDLWIIGGNVAKIIGDIFKGGGADAGGNLLDTIVKLSTKLHVFLSSADGQHKLQAFFGDLRSVVATVAKALPTAAAHLGVFKDGASVAAPIVHVLATHMGTLVKYLPLIAAAYALINVVQGIKLVRDIIHLPILAASAVANWTLASAIRGQLAATEAATVAQTELDVAMDANPIGAIIAIIMILVGVFILLWTKCSWFRDFWKGLWHIIQDAAEAVGHWFSHDFVDFFKAAWHWIQDSATKAKDWIINKFVAVVTWFNDLPAKITKIGSTVWDGLKNSFKGMVNFLIKAWNALDFGIHIHVPSWVPGVGGMGIDIDDIIPDLPYLADGGVIKHRPGGRAFVAGEAGEDEAVIPLSQLGTIAAGGGSSVLEVRAAPGDHAAEFILSLLRPVIRGRYGGDVTAALAGNH